MNLELYYSIDGGQEWEQINPLAYSDLEHIEESIEKIEQDLRGKEIEGEILWDCSELPTFLKHFGFWKEDEKEGNPFLLNPLFDLEEKLEDLELDLETVEAGFKCCRTYPILFDDFLEWIKSNYEGKYENDEDFAFSHISEISQIHSYLVIDWDKTASQLMNDFSEEDGHYFRD